MLISCYDFILSLGESFGNDRCKSPLIPLWERGRFKVEIPLGPPLGKGEVLSFEKGELEGIFGFINLP
jgi:hypothetical protein